MPDLKKIQEFIARCQKSGGSEQANSQSFLKDLCRVLDLEEPDQAVAIHEDNIYTFERKVTFPETGTEKRLDLYRKGCFVLESKQGLLLTEEELYVAKVREKKVSSAPQRNSPQWNQVMRRAKEQAARYVSLLPKGETPPPFIIVADVGYCLDIYAEFSCTGKFYDAFPTGNHRILIKDLVKPEVQELLRTIWLDPKTLNPALKAAKVTVGIADTLAKLAKTLVEDGHSKEAISEFLTRCLFTLFAEDVGLGGFPPKGFQQLLERALDNPDSYMRSMSDLWTVMNAGGYSTAVHKTLLRFNGSFFSSPKVLPLRPAQIANLLEAAKADWREVEPAIFGTLLERALEPDDREKLGAHYTPRAYVERLVLPTVIQPLQEEWGHVQVAATQLAEQGKAKAAQAEIAKFHKKLCGIHILDPACGSGNFLYVTLDHMLRLEKEVLAEAASYGEVQTKLGAHKLKVHPKQFHGIEINPQAAHIAWMVLWIGYFQWQHRVKGSIDVEVPIISRDHPIECRDAILAYRECRPAVDKDGAPITRWDGKTKKKDLVTGLDVPDEAAQVQDCFYVDPSPAEWPKADFIVGNPPFIGGGSKRSVLGRGYFEAISKCYPTLPEACDFVMYWWHCAAQLVRTGKARRFGFITTNSLGQVFNRRVTALHLSASPPLSLAFAVPDHPWVDASDGAAVRIAMTVGTPGTSEGTLAAVIAEEPTEGTEVKVTLLERAGRINSDLTIGADVAGTVQLKANADLSCPGVKLHGSGFIVTPEEAAALGLGRIVGLEKHIRHYRNGKDITDKPRGVLVIDLFGLAENDVCERFPEVYQWVLERVKPERETNASRSKDSAQYLAKWWLFGKPRETLRPALSALPRYISTSETAKHRFFVFLDANILPDNMLVNIATADAYHLGVLSSRIHVVWALAAGGRMGVGNDPRYNKTRCFETFPFPDITPEQEKRIRDLGERLDAHRKRQQGLHPDLTMTGMYNALAALRAKRELTPKERDINKKGLVTLLDQLHDELDAAVAQAYGCKADISDADILTKLVALNKERAEEERAGTVRWLRPDYQNPSGQEAPRPEKTQTVSAKKARGKAPENVPAPSAPVQATVWPKELPKQVQAVHAALVALEGKAQTEDVRKRFKGAKTKTVEGILLTLVDMGRCRQGEDGIFYAL